MNTQLHHVQIGAHHGEKLKAPLSPCADLIDYRFYNVREASYQREQSPKTFPKHTRVRYKSSNTSKLCFDTSKRYSDAFELYFNAFNLCEVHLICFIMHLDFYVKDFFVLAGSKVYNCDFFFFLTNQLDV